MLDAVRDGKIGRFPVWAIGVLIAGAVILFVFIRNKRRGETSTAQETIGAGVEENVAGIPDASFLDQIGGNYPADVSLAPLPDRPATNAQWLIVAFDFLVGEGKNPLTVQRALQKYLAGEQLTDEEKALIDLATANSRISLPPEGVNLPPISNPGPPGSSPPPGSNPSTHATAHAGQNLYDFAAAHVEGGGSSGEKFIKLFGRYKGDPTALNPTARSYMSWDGSNPRIPTFTSDRTIRIR